MLKKKEVVGIITDGDLRRMLETYENITEEVASNFMTCNPKVIQQNVLLYEALSIMKKHNITQLIVKEKDQYKGIIHLHDILKCNIF